MTCPPVMALIFPFSHKKYRRMGEAAWPEVPIAFCIIYFFPGHAQNALKSSNEDRARANGGIVMAQQGVQG